MDKFDKVRQELDRVRPPKYIDEMLVGFATIEIKNKLEIARSKGHYGWQDSDLCSMDDLKAMLIDHVEKDNMADVMAISAMIYYRKSFHGE